MQAKNQVEILLALVQNLDVFAWSPYEAPDVDLAFIVHRLKVSPSVVTKKQKLRRSVKPHLEVVIEEVRKLNKSRAIKETYFIFEWLSNTMVVRKKNGKWRVCIVFIDLK